MHRLLLILVICAALPAHAAAASAVWCVGESTKVRPGDQPQDKTAVWDGAAKTVSLGSAKNEYVAFQIAVRALEGNLQDVTVVPADLKGANGATIPVATMDLFVEHYLDVKVSSRGGGAPKDIIPHCTAGEHPAQMVPFSAKRYGAPFAVAAGRNQPVWVDIYVPEDAAAGKYTGAFSVTAGPATLAELKVELTVWNFALPHETHFRSFLYTGPENLAWGHHIPRELDAPAFIAIEERYFQMAHQHRLNFNPSAGGIVNEIGKRYAAYFDGTGFKERVGKGVGQNVLCMSPEGDTEAAIKSGAKAIVELYEAKKFTAFLFGYMWDEPHSPEDFATSKQRCKWVHDAVGKKLRTFIATPQWQKYDGGDVDIYSEPSIEDIPKVLARGDTVWAVNGGYGAGPYVDSPGFGGRSIVWMNWKMKLGGWQFWDCCYWVDKQNRKHKQGNRWVRDMTMKEIDTNPEKYLTDLWNDPLNFDESRKKGYPVAWSIRINGDGLLFYPGYEAGIDGPIASFAMKSLRRGAQDYEYLWLLQQKGKEAEANAVVDTVCPAPGKWNEDPESWDLARLKLADLLSK
ncbi:MAG: DUF4091 domain-containing protein [Planctomycetota bacterium]|nr:DUF4091 domain-containing protein [Planctomycetota bacterium]